MSERLPPLNALRVFDATMRHRSFRAAADALFVTPQAVSQQIKILEEHLNIQLFQRFGRSIEPTPDAVVLARFVENGLREFSSGVRMVTRSRYTDRINLNATPYFATRYLIPKMEGFRDIRPRCDIRLTTNVDMPEFDRDEIDVGIQWGYGDWPEVESKLLMRDHKIICCAPALMEGENALKDPTDLVKHTLLRPILPNHCWKDVIEHLNAGDVDPDNGIAFHDNASMRFAAMQGLGVGLVSARDAREEIRLGTLVAPFGEDIFWELPEERVPGFFLVHPQSRSVLPVVQEFCRWVSQQDWTD